MTLLPNPSDGDTLETRFDKPVIASEEAYAAFIKRLDALPRPNARLRKTIRMFAPWERR